MDASETHDKMNDSKATGVRLQLPDSRCPDRKNSRSGFAANGNNVEEVRGFHSDTSVILENETHVCQSCDTDVADSFNDMKETGSNGVRTLASLGSNWVSEVLKQTGLANRADEVGSLDIGIDGEVVDRMVADQRLDSRDGGSLVTLDTHSGEEIDPGTLKPVDSEDSSFTGACSVPARSVPEMETREGIRGCRDAEILELSAAKQETDGSVDVDISESSTGEKETAALEQTGSVGVDIPGSSTVRKEVTDLEQIGYVDDHLSKTSAGPRTADLEQIGYVDDNVISKSSTPEEDNPEVQRLDSIHVNDTELSAALPNDETDENQSPETIAGTFSYLCGAVLNDNLEEIRRLVSEGLEVDSFRDSRKRTVLHYAAERGIRDMIEGLVDLGASVNTADIVGKTPLHCAVGALATHFIHKKLIGETEFKELETLDSEEAVFERVQTEKIETIECLHQLGADINARFDREVTSLQRAIHFGISPAIEVLLQLGVDVNVMRFTGLTALTLAIDRNELPVIKCLLDLGADANASYRQVTALHDVVESGRADMVHLLVEHGANVNAKRYERLTPLLHALLMKVTDVDVFQCFAKHGANFNATLGSGTAIHEAILRKDRETPTALIQNGADIQAPQMNITALGLAFVRNDRDLIECLAACGADVNFRFDLCVPALIVAERVGDTEMVKELLGHRADVNDCRLLEGVTALYQAVDKQKSEMVNLLLKLGADITTKYSHKVTALHHAVSRDDIKMVKVLSDFELRVDLNATRVEEYNVFQLNVEKFVAGEGEDIALALFKAADDPDEACQCLEGVTALHDAILRLSNAAILDPDGDLSAKKEMVETLVLSGANMNATFGRGVTSLHTAVRLQKPEAVEALCKSGMKVNNMRFAGISPLSLALDRKQVSVMEYLVEFGADVTTCYCQVNALHDAVAAKRKDIVEILLIHGANANAKKYYNVSLPLHALLMKVDDGEVFECLAKLGTDMNGTLGSRAAIHEAVALQDTELVAILHKYGGDVNAPRMNITALSLALARNDSTILECLVKCGADVNFRFDLCVPVLIDCAKRGQVDMLQSLVKHGADINDCRLLQGITVLYQAVDKMKSEMVKLLLNLGSDVNSVYDHKMTALHDAVTRGDFTMAAVLANLEVDLDAERGAGHNVLHHLLENNFRKESDPRPLGLRLIRTLVKAGAGVDMGCSRGVTALHDAVKQANLQMVKFLICAGANPSPGRVQDYRPIHMVTKLGRQDLVKYLYVLGADLNAAYSMDVRPLHDAILQSNFEIVKCLFEAGAENAFTKTDGLTALHVATEAGDIEMIRFLVGKGANINCDHWVLSLQDASSKQDMSDSIASSGPGAISKLEIGSLLDVADGREAVLQCLLDLGIDKCLHQGGQKRPVFWPDAAQIAEDSLTHYARNASNDPLLVSHMKNGDRNRGAASPDDVTTNGPPPSDSDQRHNEEIPPKQADVPRKRMGCGNGECNLL
ncbi:serine/threonine-protein phosphatase 6 regulatory ankyrin repeat subunit A-like [Lineus longissimus]|uniref:serine/threonine-protein phosphatase 6 regulatory ankyrin repeat subunit A-like n=1 Tax=Lineus longissimus TaxID=88925 RepID=UPI00315D48F0